MPCYEFSIRHNAYIKACTICKHVFIGHKDQTESLKIFSQNFGVGGVSNDDGFNSACNTCKSGRANGHMLGYPEKMALYKAQNGLCAICSNQLDFRGSRVDHCHTTGYVRGILCIRCNSQLGFYERYKDRIERYLNENLQHRR